MSSYYGGGFDEWLEDSFFVDDLPPEKWAAIKTIMEPHRETVNISLEGYYPEEHSWRDFRNAIWYGYEKENETIKGILDGTIKPQDVLVPRGRAYTAEQKRAIIERLLIAWEQHPALRLGQFLVGVCERQTPPLPLFSVEDDDLAAMAEQWEKGQ